ncbi:MAG: hypothetical protein ACP5D7_20395 [Limnospira sp.]
MYTQTQTPTLMTRHHHAITVPSHFRSQRSFIRPGGDVPRGQRIS